MANHYYSCSDSYQAYASHYGFRQAFLAVPMDHDGYGPQTPLVFRSRGRHQPGDGDYFCSHVYPDKDYIQVGDVIYLLSAPYLEWRSGSWYYSYEWTGETWTEESWRYDGWWRLTTYRKYVYTLSNPRGTSGRRAKFSRDDYEVALDGDLTQHVSVLRAAARFAGHYDYAWEWGRSLSTGNPPTVNCNQETSYLADNVSVLGISPMIEDEAYLQAYQSLPSLDLNNIANIGDVISLLSSLRGGYTGLGKVGEALSSAWLGYRYAYGTTKQDINDTVEYINRIRGCAPIPVLRGRSAMNVPVSTGTATLRCSITVDTSQFRSIKSWAEQVGVQLDAYNLWDMIPYSFIVDWFLPIGNILEAARDADYATRLSPSAVWYSITHEYINVHGCRQCDYYRWRGTAKGYLFPSSYVPSLSTNKHTWLKRGADLVAISR